MSVGTGHQEFHPVYVSAANISNVARRAHGSGILPAAILPIPKGMWLNFFYLKLSSDSLLHKLAVTSKNQKSSRRSAGNYFMSAWHLSSTLSSFG